jgi:hypothetical protein
LTIDLDSAPPGVTPRETSMTKHTAGKYGRTIGQKERKAGWPAPAMAWCYLCNGTHFWAEGCAMRTGHPAFGQSEIEAQGRRNAA